MEVFLKKEFWNDLIGRSLYAFFETLLGFMVGATVFTEISWQLALSVSFTAFAIAVVKTILVGLVKFKEQ